MRANAYVAIVTPGSAARLLLDVARSRAGPAARSGIKPPATTGDPLLERHRSARTSTRWNGCRSSCHRCGCSRSTGMRNVAAAIGLVWIIGRIALFPRLRRRGVEALDRLPHPVPGVRGPAVRGRSAGSSICWRPRRCDGAAGERIVLRRARPSALGARPWVSSRICSPGGTARRPAPPCSAGATAARSARTISAIAISRRRRAAAAG